MNKDLSTSMIYPQENINNTVWGAPKGPSASIDYLIANKIDRNPIIMSELYPDRVIPRGLASPKIEDKVPITYVLDNNLMLDPVFETMLKSKKSNQTNVVNDQTTNGNAASMEEINQNADEPEENNSEVIDLPPIIVSDDEIIVDVNGADNSEGLLPADTETPEEKKRKSWGKRIAIGAIALAGLIGAGFAVNKLASDGKASDKAPTTTSVPDSGIDITGAAEGIDDELEVDVENGSEETSSTNDQEAQQDMIEEFVSDMTPEERAGISGNTSEIVVSGDVMPYTNLENAKVGNYQAAIQAALDNYNRIYSTNFEIGEGNMFWNGDRVINPAELAEYNSILKQLIEEASK